MPSAPTSPRSCGSNPIRRTPNTMQPSSLLSWPTSTPLFPPPSHRWDCLGSSSSIPAQTRISSDSSSCRRTTSPLCCSRVVVNVVEPVPQEGGVEESEFIEVGYISSVRGIKGELKVIPSTDFPELRFAKPGRRWLRARVLGKETIQEMELTEGRAHVGQKSWIVSFRGIDTVDKAKHIVGSTILVREVDRPKLDEGEFYTADLIGMRVILKETGRPVGTVVRVVNYGASDLLQVLLTSSDKSLDGPSSLKPEISASDPLVWVPFVEAIVPDVDMKKKVMEITPPKGLLELNLHSDRRPKKERRQLEWKQRKKFQQQVIASKKKLREIGQEHVLRGFLFGGKDQKNLLSHGIVDINLRLFQRAVKSISMPFERWNLAQFINAYSTQLKGNIFSLSDEGFATAASEDRKDMHHEILEKGWNLLYGSKVATILIVDGENNHNSVSEPDTSFPGRTASKVLKLKELLANKKSGKMEKLPISLPLIIVCPAHEIQSYQELLQDQDYFNFETEKLWFFEEEKLPAVDMSLTDQDTHKFLMKSPWEILKLPIGSGGVFSLLSSHQLLDDLNEMDIEYLQICSLGKRCALGNPLLPGLVVSGEADVAIKIFGVGDREDEFDIIFSMRYLSNITKQMDKLQFFAIEEQNEYVELVDKEWVSIHPNAPNSYRLQCSIYSFLGTCSPENMCFLQSGD